MAGHPGRGSVTCNQVMRRVTGTASVCRCLAWYLVCGWDSHHGNLCTVFLVPPPPRSLAHHSQLIWRWSMSHHWYRYWQSLYPPPCCAVVTNTVITESCVIMSYILTGSTFILQIHDIHFKKKKLQKWFSKSCSA